MQNLKFKTPTQARLSAAKGLFFTAPATVVALALSALGIAHAQTLGELAAAQSVKQSLELKKTNELALANRLGTSAAPANAALPEGLHAGVGAPKRHAKTSPTASNPATGNSTGKTQGDGKNNAALNPSPVVHSITRHGDTLRIELADKGRLTVARVGMQFGSKHITALSAQGVTVNDTSSPNERLVPLGKAL
jgi:hypothetical protein